MESWGQIRAAQADISLRLHAVWSCSIYAVSLTLLVLQTKTIFANSVDPTYPFSLYIMREHGMHIAQIC